MKERQLTIEHGTEIILVQWSMIVALEKILEQGVLLCLLLKTLLSHLFQIKDRFCARWRPRGHCG